MNTPSIKSLAPLIIFILLAIFLGIGLTLNPRELPSALLNKPAPAFELPILAANKNTQETFSPSQLLGQRWLLNIWASWCVACRHEHPLLNELAAKSNIIMVGLNYKDSDDKAQQWLQQRGNPYDYIPVDLVGDVGIDWGVYGVPETFVIDTDGTIIFKHVGPITPTILNEHIFPLFKGL